MTDLSVLKHTVGKPVLQNSINHADTIPNCNLLDLINVSRELEVIFDGSEENANVTNKDTPKINFNIDITNDKPANNNLEFFDRSSINLSLENHSKSRRFDSRPTPYAFDNNNLKSDSRVTAKMMRKKYANIPAITPVIRKNITEFLTGRKPELVALSLCDDWTKTVLTRFRKFIFFYYGYHSKVR